MFMSSWVGTVIAQITYDKRNQGITSILNYTIPWDTEWVRCDKNLITVVPAGYFQNLSSLDRVDFWNNLISDVEDFAFVDVPTVTWICLWKNRLRVIRRNMFSGLPLLELLELDENMIYTIQSGSLENKPALEGLVLSRNSLETVSESMFAGSKPAELAILVYENPLICDQCLAWLMQGWITVVHWLDNMKCVGPPALTWRTWDTLTLQDLTHNNTQGESSSCSFMLALKLECYGYFGCNVKHNI